MNKFIENPYSIIKNLVFLISELNNPEFKVSILSPNDTEYEIITNDDNFIFHVFHPNGEEEESPVIPRRILLQLINIHIKDITIVRLFTPKQSINFYNCNNKNCYTSAKKRLQAAQTIQKYAIPRYNNPRRPEVRSRILEDFDKFQSSFSFGSCERDLRYLRK